MKVDSIVDQIEAEMKNQTHTWRFIDDEGTFRLENPHHTSYL